MLYSHEVLRDAENENILEPAQDLQGLNDDLSAIRQLLEEQREERQAKEIAEQEKQEQEKQEQEELAKAEEEQEQQRDVIDLTFLDPCDHNLYLSSEVEYANINDVYSIMLSTRNILLLFVLIWVIFRLSSMFKNVLYKLMNK